MYGQTGSGKTFTMGGIQELGTQELFAWLSKKNRGGKKGKGPRVVVKYFELAGLVCFTIYSSLFKN